ncbi:MAG: flippase-like domain-containing protein [Chloroflexi bacterium]|nr:flippase-like domain-containing protein [Chloroflexota bacterium]
MRRGSLLRLVVGLFFSIAAVVLIAKTVTLADTLESVRRGNPLVLVPAVGLYFAGVTVRSLRWRVLLVHHAVKPALLFRSLIIGFTVNDLLPARLGELARILILYHRAGVPAGISFASILAERVLDGLVVTGFVVIGLLVVPGSEWLRYLASVAGILFVLLALGLGAAATVPAPFRRVGVAVAALSPGRWRERLTRLVETTLDGLGALTEWRTAATALGLSMVVWTIEAAMYLVIMVGFSVQIGWIAAVMATGVANLATLVPSSPGYIGTFDVALEQTLVGAFGVASADALTVAVVIHLTLVVPIVLLGLIYIWQEGFTLTGLSQVTSHRGAVASSRSDDSAVPRYSSE